MEPGPRSATRPTVSVVVPVFNKREYLETCLGSVVAAVQRDGDVELIVVDNGSTDGSLEIAQSLCEGKGRVLTRADGTIAAVRNEGARHASAPILSFLDCDCLVPPDYFARLRAVFERPDVMATGCRVDYPEAGPWVESVWHGMHRNRGEGFLPYINSGNFAVRRSAFEAVGGFDASLTTGEDAELGMRLNRDNFRIWQSRSLVVVHVDNPRTLRQFFRKEVWHALGMFGTMRWSLLDRPTIMMFIHLLLLIAALVVLFAADAAPLTRAALAVLLAGAVPAMSVGYRLLKGRRWVPIVPAIALYEVYYLARLAALMRLARGGRVPRAT